MKLNIGAGRFPLEGYVNVDLSPLPGIDVVADIHALPFPDDSVEEIKGSHILEHLKEPLKAMEELWRVAQNGALCQFRLPFGSSDDAWEDPTHVRPYFLKSFMYFSQPAYWRASYGYQGDWQPEVIRLLVLKKELSESTEWRIRHERNFVREMIVDLRCMKPAREAKRELIEQPRIEVHGV